MIASKSGLEASEAPKKTKKKTKTKSKVDGQPAKRVKRKADGDESSSKVITSAPADPSKRQKRHDDDTSTPVAAAETSTSAAAAEPVKRQYPPVPERPRNTTILLFYAYVRPNWSKAEQDAAIAFVQASLARNGCTGRVRVAREGLNSTLTGPKQGIRKFTEELRAYQPEHFGATDFKFVDDQPDNQMLKGLKVWPVSELVTYGFEASAAPLESGGNHLTPQQFHDKMTDPNAVMIDVRNFNESEIGRFRPPGTEVLDPCMRRSTEFPSWVDANLNKLKDKKVLMYCTGGIRCERASAYLTERGVEDVNQLEGGIHRYLEAFPQDGGHWVGKNYTFDRRFSHGAERSEVISHCVHCQQPWERYQAHMKCGRCKMEVIVCKDCTRKKDPPLDKKALRCTLCSSHGQLEKCRPPPPSPVRAPVEDIDEAEEPIQTAKAPAKKTKRKKAAEADQDGSAKTKRTKKARKPGGTQSSE